MKELGQLNLHGGRICKISTRGRIVVNEPFFTTTISELEALTVLAQGYSYKKTALLLGKSEGTIHRLMDKARKTNYCYRIAQLTATATELDLLNTLSIEGVKAKVKLLKSVDN